MVRQNLWRQAATRRPADVEAEPTAVKAWDRSAVRPAAGSDAPPVWAAAAACVPTLWKQARLGETSW